MTSEASTPTPYIVLTANDGSLQRVDLIGHTSWTLGRDQDNTIIVLDSSISRHHAILQYLDSNSIYLIDLGSTNGSFVNQQRVNVPTLLHHGDQVTLGQSELQFYWESLTPEDTDDDSLPGSSAKTSVLHLKRLISVLVVDIRGYTRLAQEVEVRLLSRVMGDWFQRAGQIIRKQGSRVDKYIGDAIMAVWLHNPGQGYDSESGALPEMAPDVLQTLYALLELFEMTREINAIYPLPHPIMLGAGINTGFAVVGQMGSGERQEYTVIGDTVNTAFRLESSTRTLNTDVALSEETYQALALQLRQSNYTLPNRQIPELGSVFKSDSLMLKGYSSPHQIYHCPLDQIKQFLQALS
ncbi:MAG: FHA domain-containing protein [Cyanophyceae cyanobacterium]